MNYYHRLLALVTLLTLSSQTGCMVKALPKKNDDSMYKFYKNTIKGRLLLGMTGNELAAPIDPDQVDLPYKFISLEYTDLLKILLRNGLSPDNIYNDFSLLSHAVMLNNVPACKLLIAFGANIDITNPDYRVTPLHDLCRPTTRLNSSALTIATFLLRHNANPNIQALLGHTALLSMAYRYTQLRSDTDLAITQLLIVGGTDIELKTYKTNQTLKNNQKNAFEIAVIEDYPALADTIAKTAELRDSLFKAVAQGKEISLLDTQGISGRHVRDIHGNNLLFYALKNLKNRPNNQTLAQKLIYLWPELLKERNFDGVSILDHPEVKIAAFAFLPKKENAYEEEDACPICLNAIEDLAITECKHKFCKPCMLKSLRISELCPLCRAIL